MITDDKTKIAEYYDAFLPHLQRDHVKDNQRHARVKIKLGNIVSRGETILDLGCGTGLTSQFMAKCLGATVEAVDISPKLIEFARKHSAHRNVRYQVGDITEMMLTGKFDGIVLVDVFEHIPKPYIHRLMANIAAHSHSSTWLFLNIPDGRYQSMAHIHIKDRLQIVDEGYTIADLLGKFCAIDYEPVDIDIYGIDTICQYNSILFRRKAALVKVYEEFMGQFNRNEGAQ